MRIGCLQFAPQLGDLDNNLNRADKILNKANPEDLDILVLPELAFTGYNFPSLRDISPFLEPTGAGITSVWARTTALKYNTKLVVGYPEKVDVAHRWPTSPEYFNSAIIVDQNGDTIGHYRKTHLYYTDETWALEGSGFYKGHLPGLGNVAMGICMDINPYRFEAPWHAMEFAFHVLEMEANLVILSMAWLTREDLEVWSTKSQDACMETLTYWVTRLEPLIRAEGEEEIIVVFCNRTGVEDDAVYAGTSAVIGIQNGEVTVYGMLGRGQKELLVVDTEKPGFAKLVYRPEEEEMAVDAPGAEPQVPPSNETSGGDSTDASNPTENSNASPDPNTESSEYSAESGRQSVHDHILVGSDTLWSSGTSGPMAGHIDTPISPRYFWKQPSLGSSTPIQSPSIGTHDNDGEWQAPANSRLSRNSHVQPTYRNVSRSVDTEPGDEFSRLVGNVINPGVASEASINRPTSTKSRNASRQRSHKSQSVNREEQPTQLPPLGASRNWDRDARVLPKGTTPAFKEPPLSPDLEKLGADLMVFEGDTANRAKRDSLVCHVDEDDYVILRTERKDSGKKKPSKSDAQAGRPSSRKMPKPTDSPRQSGRSHSRNKILTRSPTYPSPTGDWTPTRPASRGRHRSDSRTAPKSLSKKTSHSRITSNGVSPLEGSDMWGSTPEVSRHARHQSGNRSAVASPPIQRHRPDPVPSASKPVGHRTPEDSMGHEMALPVRTTKHRKGDSHSRSATSKATLPSPEVVGTSPSSHGPPSIHVSDAKATAPKFVPERVPPTPKAMILPPDYESATNHQSMPAPPKKQQVVPLKCLDKSTEVQDRPRSAVW
ncbi:carbon-nitrogen hydrolase [Hypoxylon cercidicola]|nr:carbon-nitrogen hydrolase [Hypoxylon cercidicola]